VTESEFKKAADTVFHRIEQALDASDTDIDYDSDGTILEMEFEDGGKVIVNRHAPTREIWLAARSGGFHYTLKEGVWFSQRDGSELFAKLAELVQLGSGERLFF
jgi:CyaY protein